MDIHGFLASSVIFLLAAVISVPLATRLGLGSVLGYLLAGVVIGPWGLGLIGHAENILHFSELGVVLLLFLIGLELNPSRLWALRRSILGMGGLQVLLSMLLISGLALSLGMGWRVALVAGMGLSLSSTAIALQLMNEKNLMGTPPGSAAFSVLLFQDLAVIPMLAVVPLLGSRVNNHGVDLAGIVLALGVVVMIVVAGRFLIRPLFRLIALTDNQDLFTAFSLLLVVGAAWLMDSVGMSMALGTFLGGVVLAESEYRHAVEIDIAPFKGLLMGLFFISVGMSVDFAVLASAPGMILALSVALVVLKFAVLVVIARLFGFHNTDPTLFGVLLSQGGEFGFVLFGAAAGALVLPADIAAVLIVVVALSMVSTPLLLLAHEHLLVPQLNRPVDTPPADVIDEGHHPVIVAGFGRFGQIVTRLLHAKRIGTTVLDHDPNQIEMLRRFGYKAFYGDATRLDLLEAAGARQASVLVIAIDDTHQALHLARAVRERWPHLKILPRVRNRQDVYEFMKLGVEVEDIARETFGSALEMGQAALRSMGFEAGRAYRIARRFHRHDMETIQALFPYHQDETSLITKAREAREDLERLMNDDEEQMDEPPYSFESVSENTRDQ